MASAIPPGGGIETAETVGQPIDDPIVAAARAYPALTLGTITGGLVVARLLAVANDRIDVALALLASAGVTNVVIGSAVGLLPLAAPLLALMLGEMGIAW